MLAGEPIHLPSADALRSAFGDPSNEELGYGNHILLARLTLAGIGFIPAEERRRILLLNAATGCMGRLGGGRRSSR